MGLQCELLTQSVQQLKKIIKKYGKNFDESR